MNGSAKVAADKRQAVEDAIQELNFRPNLMAQYLKTGQSMTLGVLTQHVESPFSNEMLRGVEHTLQGMEYVPLIVSGHWNAEEEVERLRLLVARRVDGLIILTGHVNQQTLLEFSQQIPIVATGHNIMTERVHSFSINNRLGGYMATRYLLDLGHRDIAHIVGLPDHNDAIERHHGYRQALVSAGIEYDPSLVIQGISPRSAGSMPSRSWWRAAGNSPPSSAPTIRPVTGPFWGSSSAACGCLRMSLSSVLTTCPSLLIPTRH